MMLLGGYQFSEFLLCVTPFTELWTKVGFVIYTFLPAVALHSVLFRLNKKITTMRLAFIYAVPVVTICAALIPGLMVAQALCETIFITAHIFQPNDLGYFTFWVYCVYYAGFIIASAVISINAYIMMKSKSDRNLFLYYPAAIALMTIPTFIFLVVFPHFGLRFPSVLCHFALFLAAVVFAGVRREEINQANKNRDNMKIE